MAVGTLASPPVFQVFDANGDPLPGAQLFSYLAGTSTPSPIYHDAALLVPWSNPAIADSGGYFNALYLGSVAQKWVLEDQFGVVVWTVDPVTAAGAAGGAATPFGEEFDFEGNSSIEITNTTYPAGATADKLHPGTAILSFDSAAIVGTYELEATGVQLGGGTMTVGLFDLSSGSPNTPLATLLITSATGELARSGTITFGLPGIARLYGIKVLVSSGTGFAWGIHLLRVADPVVVPPPADTGFEEIFDFDANPSIEITNTTYALGGLFNALLPGSWVYQKDSISLSSGTYVLRIFGVTDPGTPCTLFVSLFDLSGATPDTPIATANITSSTGAVGMSGTITWGTPGGLRNYGVKALVTAGTAFVIGAKIVKLIP